MRRRVPVVAETDDAIPLWVRHAPACPSDPVVNELVAMTGAPLLEDLDPEADREPWGRAWGWLFALDEFRCAAARAWCEERGLVQRAAECGLAVSGPVDAFWSADRGLRVLDSERGR